MFAASDDDGGSKGAVAEGEKKKGKSKQLWLPEGPSLSFIALLVGNTLLMTPFALLAMVVGIKVEGSRFAVDGVSTMIAIYAAAGWSMAEWLLPTLFPKQAKQYEDVNAHTELFAAITFGTKRGGFARTAGVVAGSAIISVSAGIFEELVFRGTAQRILTAILCVPFSPIMAHAAAIIFVATVFGSLHNYCKGYVFFASLAGVFFGALYSITENLYTVALTHALIDFSTFLLSYSNIVGADAAKKKSLLSKTKFDMINKLIQVRQRLDIMADNRSYAKKKLKDDAKKYLKDDFTKRWGEKRAPPMA